MNYIGSKYKLLSFIRHTIHQVMGEDLSDKVLCDLFAGTGIVGRAFKNEVRQVVSNDMEYYSFVLNRNYIGNRLTFDASSYLNQLNALAPTKGFIYNEYSQGGTAKRLYFSQDNGQKIDAIRQQIQRWKQEKAISQDLYYFLLASLIESADKVANTASVYGAFLKHMKKTAQRQLLVQPALFEPSPNSHLVYNQDANTLISKIQGDILYLDPPYNARQYGANYHLLNTIAQYDSFIPKGKTGLRPYHKSDFCKPKEVGNAFEELIKKAQFRYILLSYNNEGLMNQEQIRKIMTKYGRYDLATTEYTRFKADKQENRNHKANSTIEFVHILEK